MSSTLQISLYAATHTGMTREHNEDNFCVILPDIGYTPNGKAMDVNDDQAVLLAVADGMGGTQAGEVASRIAVETIQSRTEIIKKLASTSIAIEASLKNLIVQAHDEILNTAAVQPESKGMGTTLTLAYLQKNKLFLCWSGDSRAYLFHDAGVERLRAFDLPKLRVLSDDHSLVWDKVKAGVMSPDQARVNEYSNVITQSLGDPFSAPKPESAKFDLVSGQKILLCSDGLNSMLPDEYIETILSSGGTNEELVNTLIEAANEAGGRDNITVILASIEHAPPIIAGETTSERPTVITAKSGGMVQDPAGVATQRRQNLPLLAFAIFIALGAIGYVLYETVVKDFGSESTITPEAIPSKATYEQTNQFSVVTEKPIDSQGFDQSTAEKSQVVEKSESPQPTIPKVASDKSLDIKSNTPISSKTKEKSEAEGYHSKDLEPESIESAILWASEELKLLPENDETKRIQNSIKKTSEDLRNAGHDLSKLTAVRRQLSVIYQDITALINQVSHQETIVNRDRAKDSSKHNLPDTSKRKQ